MGEEDRPHGRALNYTGAEAERVRAERVFGAYERDPRKQRAWSAENPGNRAIREEVVRALLPWVPAEGAILDAGCGTGWLLARLAAEGVRPERLHGVDVLERRAAAAAAAVPGARVVPGDVRALPYEDGAMALVTLLTVLSSLASAEDVAAALREVRRVLAPGGAVAVWEPRVPTPGNRRTLLVTRRTLAAALGEPVASARLTLLPPLARRLGARTPRLYAPLARIPLLTTHRLSVHRPFRQVPAVSRLRS